jgi:hypothetical protein
MGSLNHFHIDRIRKRHGLVSFVESGTGEGAAVAQAVAAGFPIIHSIEIVDELVDAARRKFKNWPQVKIWRGDSRDVLPILLKELPGGPALFWLDGHFPGADYGLRSYDSEPDVRTRLPLEDEIGIISKARQHCRDVILIDDARVYQSGPYVAGNLPADWPALNGVTRSLDFVRDAYGKTHGVVVDFAETGFCMVVPHAD